MTFYDKRSFLTEFVDLIIVQSTKVSLFTELKSGSKVPSGQS